jgi:signal transduction histidine kinase
MERAKILIVDDELGPRESLRMILKDHYSLSFATNGKEAVDYVQNHGVDLVIMDMKMPEMDGITALKEIKKINPFISVLMVTGYGTIDTAVEAMKIGAYDYISKPFDAQHLMDAVEKGLSRMREVKERERMLNDLKNMSENLLKRQNELQAEIIELSKLSSVGMLAQGIAHNLSSPLLIILGRAELMREKLIELKKRMEERFMDLKSKELQFIMKEYDQNIHDTEIIIENVAKLTEIIRNIMKKSRQDQTREPQLINLSQLLKDELKFLEADLFFKHNIKKHFELDESVPPIKGIYSDFSQSFLNIIKNAIDAMYETPVKELTVKCYYDEDAIYVEVTDTGCGIKDEHKDKIFEPYFTTKPLISNGKGPWGTGIGLHMAKVLLEPYNANITFTSRPNLTTFTISIPYKELQ